MPKVGRRCAELFDIAPRGQAENARARTPSRDRLTPMNEHHPTRREVLRGMAAVHLVEDTLKAQAGDSSVCFMSTVEMAGLIRTKKLSARGRPSPTKQRRPVLVRIDPSPGR